MIELSDFDYDTCHIKVKCEGKDDKIVIKSGFTPEAIQASHLFSMSCDAAKEQGIALDEEIDNHGIKITQQTETYKKLVAQYAEKLVIDWPYDVEIFDALLANQSAAWAIINRSNERSKEFFEKKTK